MLTSPSRDTQEPRHRWTCVAVLRLPLGGRPYAVCGRLVAGAEPRVRSLLGMLGKGSYTSLSEVSLIEESADDEPPPLGAIE
jgi:hypothetical protein